MNAKKLLAQALRSPQGLRFTEACQLAEAFGFRHARTKGSHAIFSRPDVRPIVSLQNAGGNAKAYQVKQMLKLLKICISRWRMTRRERLPHQHFL